MIVTGTPACEPCAGAEFMQPIAHEYVQVAGALPLLRTSATAMSMAVITSQSSSAGRR